jgi:glycerol-3-phosphate acyltransferase PlsX
MELLPVAVDAMGGDYAPSEIVAGARLAVDELGIDVVLVGDPDLIGDARGLKVLACHQVIGMDEDGARAVRLKKDSSLVRAAEAVRDGVASAMVSAGNTGATMASALLRMRRLPGVARPAIATPIPVPGMAPTIMLDAGANADCSPPWLVQFARMGAVLAAERYGIASPRVGLLSIGEESTKGSTLVKGTHSLLVDGGLGTFGTFIGNIEGRDIMTDKVDVVVTDGFTGNVVLKTLEGGMRFLVDKIGEVMTSTPEARAAAEVLLPMLAPLASELEPDNTGGAMLLGVGGVCIISHGSSKSRAIVNAVRVGRDAVQADLVAKLASAIAVPDGSGSQTVITAPDD